MKILFRNKVFLLIFYFLTFTFEQANSQTIGLVLSGGSAKGLAHIGVIRALEENNIPIDYIAGTSIGSMIAGLYAIGYSPAEMEALFKSEEFRFWYKGLIQEKYYYFYKKNEDNPALVRFKFTNDSLRKAQLPSNVVPSHQMDFAMMQTYGQGAAKANYNFDSLFVPFRCTAVDIYENQQVIFRKGDLASSIRASMTYPVYIKPIIMDGRLMFDGGLINNFPMDVMEQDFHPDIIIGSKVSTNSQRPDEDDILLQLENMLMAKTNYNIPDEKGIVIEAMVQDIALFDFHKANELIAYGYRAAMLRINEIKTLIRRRVDKLGKRFVSIRDLERRRKYFRSKLPEMLFDSIHISGLNASQAEYITKLIRKKENVVPVDQLKSEYFKLFADGQVENIYPTAKFNPKTNFFDIYLRMKQAKSLTAEIGGNISSGAINQGFAALEYRYLWKKALRLNLNANVGKFYISGMLKSRVDFPAAKPFFLDFSITYSQYDYIKSNPDVFFDDVRPMYLVQNEVGTRLDVGMPLQINGKISTGAAFALQDDEYYQTKTFKTTDKLDETKFLLFSSHFTYETKTLNERQYPDQGRRAFFQIRYTKGIETHTPGTTAPQTNVFSQYHNFFQAKFVYENYYQLHNRFVVGLYFEAVHSQKKFFNNYTSTILSAPVFQPTPQSKTLFLEYYRANSYAATGIISILRVNEECHWRSEVYLFQPLKTINQRKDEKGNYVATYGLFLQNSYALFSSAIIYFTLFGPASFSVNTYRKDETSTYFVFNFGYLIFNKRVTD